MAIVSHLAIAAFVVAAQPVTERPIDIDAIKARHEVCYMLATSDAYPSLDIADCLSFDTAPYAEFNRQVCNFLREADQFREYDFSSYADCIKRGVIR